MNQVHCLGSVQEFGISKIEINDKKCEALLQGSEISVRLHFMSLILGFYSCRMAAVSVYPWASGQRNKSQPQGPQFDPEEGTPVNFSDIVNLLLTINDGRGGMPNYAL